MGGLMEEDKIQKNIESQLLDLTSKMNTLKSDLIKTEPESNKNFVSPNRDIPEKYESM